MSLVGLLEQLQADAVRVKREKKRSARPLFKVPTDRSDGSFGEHHLALGTGALGSQQVQLYEERGTW